MQMPQMDGIELVKKMRSLGSKIPILIISAFGYYSHANKAIQAGANEVLEKPFERNQLLKVIIQLLQKK